EFVAGLEPAFDKLDPQGVGDLASGRNGGVEVNANLTCHTTGRYMYSVYRHCTLIKGHLRPWRTLAVRLRTYVARTVVRSVRYCCRAHPAVVTSPTSYQADFVICERRTLFDSEHIIPNPDSPIRVKRQTSVQPNV